MPAASGPVIGPGVVVCGGVLGVLLLAGHGRVIVVLVVAGCC